MPTTQREATAKVSTPLMSPLPSDVILHTHAASIRSHEMGLCLHCKRPDPSLQPWFLHLVTPGQKATQPDALLKGHILVAQSPRRSSFMQIVDSSCVIGVPTPTKEVSYNAAPRERREQRSSPHRGTQLIHVGFT